jgi:hypothetical protein
MGGGSQEHEYHDFGARCLSASGHNLNQYVRVTGTPLCLDNKNVSG